MFERIKRLYPHKKENKLNISIAKRISKSIVKRITKKGFTIEEKYGSFYVLKKNGKPVKTSSFLSEVIREADKKR